jgi:hypothetical protein
MMIGWKCTRLEAVGKRPRGRPRKTWMELKDDMRRGALFSEDAKDRGLWRIHGAKQPTRVNLNIT